MSSSDDEDEVEATSEEDKAVDSNSAENQNRWFLELSPEEKARFRAVFEGNSNIVAPVSIEAERQSLASDLSNSVTDRSAASEKSWFKKMIREGVYVCFKFVCGRDRKYNSQFCDSVFASVGRPKNETEWGPLCKKAEAIIGELRSSDSVRIKESFDRK